MTSKCNGHQWLLFCMVIFSAMGGCRPADDDALLENLCDLETALAEACGICDPAPHCISPQSCSNSAECPSGTYCSLAVEGASGETWPVSTNGSRFETCSSTFEYRGAESAVGRCEVPVSRGAERHALTDGFHVAGFSLTKGETDTGRFTAFSWKAPSDTVLVHCGLFTCPPEIVKTGSWAKKSGSEKKGAIYSIINFDQCAIASELFESKEGVFDLGNEANAYWVESEVRCKASRTRKRVVTDLLAGCWAFGPSRIVAATPLESVDPTMMFNYGDIFDLGCSRAENGGACIPGTGRAFGVCVDRTCLNTCVDHRDCAILMPWAVDAGDGDDAGARDLSMPVYQCVKETGAFVGVCLPDPSGDVDAGEAAE